MSKRKQAPVTLAQVSKGKAVFHVPSKRSRVYDLGRPLPIPARVKIPLEVGEGQTVPVGTIVNIVQLELVDDVDILEGFRFNNDEEGLCMLHEIELLPER